MYKKMSNTMVKTGNFKFLNSGLKKPGMNSGCMKCQAPEQSLFCAKPGERLVVVDINGGRKANMRLRAMGIKKGDQIEVVNIFGGQMVLAVDYTRLAICRGLTKKIIVEPVS